jgi:hypothetical protein
VRSGVPVGTRRTCPISQPTHSQTIADLQTAITGIQKRFAGQSLTLGGVPYTVVALAALFQSLVNAITQAAAAKVAAKDAVANVASLTAQVMPVHADLLSYVASTLGRSAAVAADFGPVPKARKVPTPAEKAAAAQKAKVTRAANAAKRASSATAAAGTSAPATPATGGTGATAKASS